jgi:hypothetical protein
MDLHNDGRWSLLLTPVDGIETKRDGGFSFLLNGEKRKTYSYDAVNAKASWSRNAAFQPSAMRAMFYQTAEPIQNFRNELKYENKKL